MEEQLGLDPVSSGPLHRRAVLLVLLALTVSCGVLFLVINLRRGNQTIALAELLMAAYAGGLMVVVRRTTQLYRWTLAYLIPFFSVMLMACWSPRSTSIVFVWVLLIPIVAHLLLGRRTGLSFSLVFMTGAGLIFMHKYAVSPEQFIPVAIADVVLCAICILGLAHVYEISREQTEIRLRQMAMRDALTGLANRSLFQLVFERANEAYQRARTPVSVLLIDIDYFKMVNDTHGHEAGDAVLCFLARLFEHQLRASDLVCRLGGEEFAVILADSDIEQAISVADILRRAVAADSFAYGQERIALTVTIGAAELGNDGTNLKMLLACADRRLYQGKAAGRNQVVAVPLEQCLRA